jgi:folate-dependent phosphoribosylglycinamide formyltransferase PurN
MTSERPRVAVLCSYRAPGLRFLLEDDPARGEVYDLVCCLSSEEECAAGVEAERNGLPFISHPLARFAARNGTRKSDLAARVGYDVETIDLLRPYRADLLLLSSYLLVVTEPLLRTFPDSLVNVHDSDLTKPPRYPGLHAVRDAIFAGEAETRATAHLVTPILDGGPVLCRSEAFPVSPLVRDALGWGASDVLKAYAYAHREWMIHSAWGPLLSRSIQLLAESRRRPVAVT